MHRQSFEICLPQHTRAMNRCIDHAVNITCRGSGGRLATGTLWVAGSATGALWALSPLACAKAHMPRQQPGCGAKRPAKERKRIKNALRARRIYATVLE